MPEHTAVESTQNLRIACVGRQHNHFCVGKFVANRNERIDAVHLRHLQVHERDVGMMHPELLDSIASVTRLSYHNHVRLNAD